MQNQMTSFENTKSEIVSSGLGQALALTVSNTWSQVIEKIKSVVNRGTLNWSGSNTTYGIPAGYYSGGTLDSRPSYSNGYNAGVTAADNRSNPNSTNYKTGYNAGVAAADARVNTGSASYTSGYNNGINVGRSLKSATYTVPGTTSDYTWKNTGNGNDKYGHIQVTLNLGTHTIVGAHWYNSSYSDSWILTCNGYMMRQNKSTFTRQDTGPTGAAWATDPVLHLPSGGSGSHTVIVWYV